jgi:hypothetical protein
MPFDCTQIQVLVDNSVTENNPAGDIVEYTITMSQLEQLKLITSDPIPLESTLLDVISKWG